jgi:hypothetical protein
MEVWTIVTRLASWRGTNHHPPRAARGSQTVWTFATVSYDRLNAAPVSGY